MFALLTKIHQDKNTEGKYERQYEQPCKNKSNESTRKTVEI